MKVLVAYMSQTGNTKKVAETIFEAISMPKEIKPLEEVTSLNDYDLSFLGFPVHAQSLNEKTTSFLNSMVNGQKIAIFITHGAPEVSPNVPGWLKQFRDAAIGADICGVFDCQGEMSQQVLNFMLNNPNPQIREWAKRDSSKGQPDASRLEKAKIFAENTMKNILQ